MAALLTQFGAEDLTERLTADGRYRCAYVRCGFWSLLHVTFQHDDDSLVNGHRTALVPFAAGFARPEKASRFQLIRHGSFVCDLLHLVSVSRTIAATRKSATNPRYMFSRSFSSPRSTAEGCIDAMS